MNHNDLRSKGRLPHWKIDAALDPSGAGYGVDDCLSLESNLGAPATGTAPSRVSFLTYFSLWQFPNTASRYLQSVVQLPHGYVSGTDLLWHVHFSTDSDLTTGQTVIWKIDASGASFGDVIPGLETYTSTYTAPSAVSAGSHLLTTSVVIPGAALTGSAFVLGRVWRDITDTYNGNALLLGSDYHIRKNRIGSRGENPTT